MSLTIPTDLDRWAPADVTAWLRDLEDDDLAANDDLEIARSAVASALLG
jgi:hypothetical protein